MRQDGCIRKLGGELQIKVVKFVNSNLQSVRESSFNMTRGGMKILKIEA